MSDWYKMQPVDWNDGTDNLTLEQEAAYLRLCHAMYITGKPVRDNHFVLAGLFRCNDRRAKRLILELVSARKITVENGLISNRRAMEEISERNRIAIERKSAGSRGGVESAKSRTKPLENNETHEAIASTYVEPDKIREDKIINIEEVSAKLADKSSPVSELMKVLDETHSKAVVEHRRALKKPLTEHGAKLLAGKFSKAPDPNKAADFMIERGHQGFEIEWMEAKTQSKFGPAQYQPTSKPTQTREQWLAAERERSERSFR